MGLGKDSTWKFRCDIHCLLSSDRWHPAHHFFFFFSQVQLENTYNEGTSVLSDHFAYLGVVKAYLSYGIDFPAQLLSSVLNMGNQA